MIKSTQINNPVKKALLERQVTFGSWLQLGPYPGVAEVLANAGYDWLAIDCEHSDIDIEGFSTLARAIHGRGPTVMIRVKENDVMEIRQALDMGAQGIIVPLINNANEAEKAVAAAKYPPCGIRGFCFGRMNNYGEDFVEYVQTANNEIAVIVMIESKEAVENIDEILSVDGVDGVFVGPYDLSGSYGITGQTSHKVIQTALKKIAESCRQHNKSAGLHIVYPTEEAIEKTISDGFTFIALGVDMVFLREGCKTALNSAKSITLKKRK